MKKYRSNILKTEFIGSKEIRDIQAGYKRIRREKIKLGLIPPEKRKVSSTEYQREYQRNARRLVIKKYGGKCKCCGEDKVEFLAMDHINGGGRKHRMKIRVTNIALWIIRNNFPKGFRILCHNCNMAKGIYGKCPHKYKK